MNIIPENKTYKIIYNYLFNKLFTISEIIKMTWIIFSPKADGPLAELSLKTTTFMNIHKYLI